MSIYSLAAGHVLTVTVSEGATQVHRADDVSVGALVTLFQSFGPFLVDTEWVVEGGLYTAYIAADTRQTTSLISYGDDVPVSAVRATLTVNPAGDDNGLVYTARKYGAEGNLITVAYVDPSANNAALAVSVFRRAITVSLATGGGGAITSTAAQVKAAIEANAAANALVSIAIMTADSGVADDGSGVVTAMAAAALSGGVGTGIGTAMKGGLYLDYTNGKAFINTGTTAAPTWVELGLAS